ncbi:hypothetical protein [Ensifer adhaerens]|uniref:hypothetical protein n=1 Tax=Ensifer adhaerens TaxID=106592 RepID=UPI00098E8D82|nr:hypothetical protein [Ensifer adhaerens]
MGDASQHARLATNAEANVRRYDAEHILSQWDAVAVAALEQAPAQDGGKAAQPDHFGRARDKLDFLSGGPEGIPKIPSIQVFRKMWDKNLVPEVVMRFMEIVPRRRSLRLIVPRILMDRQITARGQRKL